MNDSSTRGRLLAFTQLVVRDLQDERLTLEGSEARHLLRSIRAKPGDVIEATDGRGTRAQLEVVRLDGKQVELGTARRRYEDMPPRRWWLATWAEGSRFDWLVEKAVELGAWGLAPLRTPSAHRADRSRRWGRLAAAALGQCRGAWHLTLTPPRTLREHLESGPDRRWQAVVWGDMGGERAGSLDPESLGEGDLLLVIGPPGGLEADEVAELTTYPNSRAISFGDRRLRSETAALAALVWAHCTGRG